jgi:hypothetical protein
MFPRQLNRQVRVAARNKGELEPLTPASTRSDAVQPSVIWDAGVLAASLQTTALADDVTRPLVKTWVGRKLIRGMGSEASKRERDGA